VIQQRRHEVAMRRTLNDFLEALNRHVQRVPLDELEHALTHLDIVLNDVRDYVCFDRDNYRRNLLHTGRCYEALVLCWRPGQRSPIHDHRDSSCGVRVLAGTATETRFARNETGLVFATGSRTLPEGSICATADADTHQMSNLQPAGDLVTLHIYSPALRRMNVYSLTDPAVREYCDPVHILSFAGGAGI